MSIFEHTEGREGSIFHEGREGIIQIPTKVGIQAGLPGNANTKANSDHQHELDLTNASLNSRNIYFVTDIQNVVGGDTGNLVGPVGPAINVGATFTVDLKTGDKVNLWGDAFILCVVAAAQIDLTIYVGGVS